jgi:hypothetical protein
MIRFKLTRGEGRAIGFAAGMSLLIAASALTPQPAHGAESVQPNEPVFGNTITIDIRGKFSARRYMDADHSYTQTGGVRGTWEIVGDDICFTQIEPPREGLEPECPPNAPHRLGDTWTNIDANTGNTVVIGLVAGRP